MSATNYIAVSIANNVAIITVHGKTTVFPRPPDRKINSGILKKTGNSRKIPEQSMNTFISYF